MQKHALTYITAAVCMASLYTAAIASDQAITKMTMDDAVKMAIKSNPGLMGARSQVEAARARIGAARAGLLPQVNAGVQFQDFSIIPVMTLPLAPSNVLNIPLNVRDNYGWSVSARQAIYTGGALSGSISKNEALYDAASGQLGTAESQTAFLTRQAYYSVLLNKALVKSAEQNLTAAQSQLNDAQARFEAGAAAKYDVLRAQTQLSQAEQALVLHKNQVEIAKQNLNRVIGAAIDAEYELVEPAQSEVPDTALPALLDTAMKCRTELLSARAQAKAAEYGVKIAKSGLYPQVNFSANYQDFNKDSMSVVQGWTFVASLSKELFDGGRIKEQIREAKAMQSAAAANLEETKRSIEQDVRRACLNLQTARTTINTAKNMLAQSEEAHNVATIRYQSGVGTATELADAIASLMSARANYDTSLYDYDIAYASLQHALGLINY